MTTFQINKESNIAGKTLKTLRVRKNGNQHRFY
jgi:hypothetical protein